MSRVVIADTVEHARTIARGLTQPGSVAISTRGIEHHGAGRGLVVSDMLVDDSALPLPSKAQQLVDIWTTLGARVHRRRNPGECG